MRVLCVLGMVLRIFVSVVLSSVVSSVPVQSTEVACCVFVAIDRAVKKNIRLSHIIKQYV